MQDRRVTHLRRHCRFASPPTAPQKPRAAPRGRTMGFNLCCFCVTGPVNTLDPAAQIVAYESTKRLQEDFDEGRKLGEGMFGKVVLMTRSEAWSLVV